LELLSISFKEIVSMGISIAEVMEVVEKGFRLKGEGKNEMPAKIGIHPRHDCFIHAMPCWMAGDVDAAGIKWVSGYPPNQAKGLPYITGVLCLNDSETGIPKAIMDANWITAWRTGAASGVCAKYMARPNSKTVAVIGLGVQGRTNLMAMNEALPELEQVKVFDVVERQASKYVTEMSSSLPNLSFETSKSIQETVRDADVVITCTPILAEPNRFVRREWLKDTALALSVDYDSAFDADVMTGSSIFVCDDLNQYLWTQQQGVYFQEGYPIRNQIFGDMGEICAGTKQPEPHGLRGAVLMGIASHDIMTADLIYRKALKQGIGNRIEL